MMPRFSALVTCTPQGAKALDGLVDRSHAFRESAAAVGANVERMYWALGEFDGAVILEAPADQTAISLMDALARAGNDRARTTRLYDETESSSIVEAATKL